MRVRVPLRQGNSVAVIVSLSARAPEGFEARPIIEVLDRAPFYDANMMKFLQWASDYYLASPGLVLRAAMPAHSRAPAPKRKKKAGEKEVLPEEIIEGEKIPRPTPAQAAALEPVVEAVRAGKNQVFLLHGVTASGKTEVYLRAAAAALEMGKSAVILVPEIALSYQVVARFTARFPGRVSVLHSRLTGSERTGSLEEVRRGPRIVIGARSAVFAPAIAPGLFVVDEEHESAYKQDEHVPFYHARECALVRAKLENCPVVLGSATPSLESAAQARQGRFTLLTLPDRIDRTPLPLVEVVPMNQEPSGTVIGSRLAGALKDAMARGEQALLFLNRRGFASTMLCGACGAPLRCTECSTSMVVHSAENRLKCHWCGRQAPIPGQCPACKAMALRPIGFGTQRIEQEVHELLPDARVVRMDQDTTRQRLAHRDLLDKFTKGDILIGTQMVAKGLDFPRLSLVGIVLADLSLSLPDFRAGERTFQLAMQVAGRAGRRERQGLVILQTFAPRHPAIVAAAEQDYWKFYAGESAQRKALGYPPIGRIIRFRFTGADRNAVVASAKSLARFLSSRIDGKTMVLGPAPAMPSVVARRHHWHLLMKGANGEAMRKLAQEAVRRAESSPEAGKVQISADVNPLNVLS
jgi:primosomal protein N' (replication factor Y)